MRQNFTRENSRGKTISNDVVVIIIEILRLSLSNANVQNDNRMATLSYFNLC